MDMLETDVFDLAARLLDAYPEPVPFEDFGPYRIGEAIGRGGMGEVFAAEDLPAGRRVAIKFLAYAWSAPDLRERFTREIKTLAKLEHPFIARLYDAGIHPGGTPYFAMEYVEGKPLDQYCRERECSAEERLRLFRAVCAAVQYAHAHLVVHRDLKPSNILVTEDGTPKLLDFGIAKQLENPDVPANQTQTELRFTRAYAAPEQLRGESVGVYTDVYALGVILYELLAAKPPYELEKCTPLEAETIVAGEQEPEKPSASIKRVEAGKAAWSDLDVLCLKAMKKEVSRRYHSVVELTQDIDRYLKGEPLKARPDTVKYRMEKFLRRNGRAVLTVAAVIAVIAGLVAFYTIRLAAARDDALTQAARTQRIQRFMLSMFGGDPDAAPSGELRVVDILDQGVRDAQLLNREPAVQAELYKTLGTIYQNLGKLDRADGLLQSSLERRRSVAGTDRPEFAESLSALALLRVDQGRFAEAEKLARQGVAVVKRHASSDDPVLGRAMSALGEVLDHRGSYGEAIQVLDEAVRIQSKPGAEAADLKESLTYLSMAHHLLGQDALAEPLQQRVLAVDRQLYGDRHPSVAEDLSNLGQMEEQRGQYAEAERDERQALEIDQAWYGKDQMEVALLSEALAGTLIHEREYEEAERLLEPALRIQERDGGKDHPFVALALSELGFIALKRGNVTEAEADFRRMMQIYRSAFGEKDKHVAIGLARFGELYLARNEYAPAEQAFREATQLFSTTLSPDNVQAGAAKIELGEALFHQRRYQEAEAQLLAGYRIVTREGVPTLDSAINARKNLVDVYEALHSPEKAAKFRGGEIIPE